MIKRFALLYYLLLIIPALTVLTASGYPESPPLRLMDPYFLKPNNSFFGLQFESIAIQGGFLHFYELSIDYGVNDRVLVAARFPYLSIPGANDGGCIGDIFAALKLLLFQSDDLFWRISSSFDFQFPTGITREDSKRTVEGNQLSYYPYTIGSSMLSPALGASLFLESFAVHTSIIYESINTPTESILNFNSQNDLLNFQLLFDYLWKLLLNEDSSLFIRPAIYLEYKHNLSSMPIIPDGLYITLESSIRMERDWKLRCYYSFPVSAQNATGTSDMAVQFGFYFQ